MSQHDPPDGGPPPGWYPDPQRDGQQRWWNGSRWTEHTAPRQAEPGPPQPGRRPPGDQWGDARSGGAGDLRSAPWGGPDAGQSWPARAGASGPPPVSTWLWQSIAVTLLCCMPVGIVGIVFAAQAQGALNVGDVVEARRKADVARNVTIAGFVLGLFAIPLVLLVQM